MGDSIATVPETVDVLVVGAGFSGIQALHLLGKQGISVHLVDKATGVGGTWFWNRYPGARVDIESMEYSMALDGSLQQEWEWTEKYAGQPEVENYLNWATDRLELRDDMTLGVRLTSARWDADTSRWTSELVSVTSDDDAVSERTIVSRFLILATGFLSAPAVPDVEGLDDFEGSLVYTARWPAEGVELAGKQVGVLGTGASGVQVVQTVSGEVADLHVFQRTAAWCFPLRNEPIRPEYEAWVKENYSEIRRLEREVRGPGMVLMGGEIALPEMRSALEVSDDERVADFENRWTAGGVHMGRSFIDLIRNQEANDSLRVFLEQKIREIVKDPVTAEKLIPNIPPLSRRPPGEQGYYEAFNLPNVHLVDVAEDPIVRVTKSGIELISGRVVDLDVLVCATGFDAGGGSTRGMNISTDQLSLAEAWSEGVQTHLGLMVAGLPNLFLINGPQSPGVHFSPPLTAEFQVELILEIIDRLDSSGQLTVTVDEEAQGAWVNHLDEIYGATILAGSNSWWVGTNIAGKKRQPVGYAGGYPAYRKKALASLEDGSIVLS